MIGRIYKMLIKVVKILAKIGMLQFDLFLFDFRVRMMGDSEAKGVIPRFCEELFSKITNPEEENVSMLGNQIENILQVTMLFAELCFSLSIQLIRNCYVV